MIWLPTAGVLAFTILYFVAASLYPGGTWQDRNLEGYHHFSNYWCDLLRPVSHSGRVNQARPIALLATVSFPLSLIPFWLALPKLFQARSWLARWVAVGGCLAMLSATMVFLPFHDQAIKLGALVGFSALLGALLGLWRAGQKLLVGLGGLFLVAGGVNYFMWQERLMPLVTPAVQKVAISTFLLWVFLTSVEIYGAIGAPRGTK